MEQKAQTNVTLNAENAKQLHQRQQVNFNDAQAELAPFGNHRHTPLQTSNRRGKRILAMRGTALEAS